MNLYMENGYVNQRAAIQTGMPFIFEWGGRGTGKTVGSLEMAVSDGIKFIYMRRTQTQCDMINKPEFSPFKTLNSIYGWNIGTQTLSKYNAGFYHMIDDGEKLTAQGNPIGYTCALSTIANMRGFDASDVDLLIYDEFIPEKHERPLKNEAAAFFNAYETVNRNREFSGKPPLQMLCLSNANDMANPIFLSLNLVRKADSMSKKCQEIYIDKEKRLCLINLQNSPISYRKNQTALYRLTAGTEFSDMSIKNDFAWEERSTIKGRPIVEYRPIVTVGEITIYSHKSNGTHYISTHRRGTPPIYGSGEIELSRFQAAFRWVWFEYMANKIVFEEYLCEVLLNKYFS